MPNGDSGRVRFAVRTLGRRVCGGGVTWQPGRETAVVLSARRRRATAALDTLVRNLFILGEFFFWVQFALAVF